MCLPPTTLPILPLSTIPSFPSSTQLTLASPDLLSHANLNQYPWLGAFSQTEMTQFSAIGKSGLSLFSLLLNHFLLPSISLVVHIQIFNIFLVGRSQSESIS